VLCCFGKFADIYFSCLPAAKGHALGGQKEMAACRRKETARCRVTDVSDREQTENTEMESE